jgi:Flp pilus assembly protein TadD
MEARVASTISERRTLRRIPELRALSSRELDEVQGRMGYRAYRAGDVIWRTHGLNRLTGYLRSGEVDLEYRVGGVLVRAIRLRAGDPLICSLKDRRPHATLIVRAVTNVRLGILLERSRSLGQSGRRMRARAWASDWSWNVLWAVMLSLLTVALAWTDLTRIASGLLYLASTDGGLSPHLSMSLLQEAGQMDPTAAFAYNAQGYRLFQQARLLEAQAAFAQAVNRDPTSAPAINNLAITSFLQGDVTRAAGYLDRTLQQDPDNATARYNLGIALMQLNDAAGAIQQFREASFIDPQAASPLLLQCYLYNQIGDYAQAEQRARSALELDPSLAQAHLLLAVALYNQGREDEALASVANSLSIEPENRVTSFYQALILGHLKQYDAALPILQDLLVTSTDTSESTRLQEEIDALDRLQAESETAGP